LNTIIVHILYVIFGKFSLFGRTNTFVLNNKIKIGLLGEIDFIKGQDIFVKAASKVAKEYSYVEFLIIGDNQDTKLREYTF